MTPSPLYNKLLSLSKAHAEPKDTEQIMSIRAPNAMHGWGHNHLVRKNPALGMLDNTGFLAHLKSSSPLFSSPYLTKVTEIVIDEYQRKASIRMSYFLRPTGSDEVVENDLIWLLTFTGEDEAEGGVDGVLIKESIEFIDAAASGRVGMLLREKFGEFKDDVKGGARVVL